MDEAPTLGGMSPAMRVAVTCSALILALIALCPVLIWLKRRLRGGDESSSVTGFSIDELESMRESGRISEAEFKRLRSSALGVVVGGKAERESELSNSTESDDEKAETSGGKPSA